MEMKSNPVSTITFTQREVGQMKSWGCDMQYAMADFSHANAVESSHAVFQE